MEAGYRTKMAQLRTGEGLADVVVTAVAATTAIAPDAHDTWQALLDGKSGIRTLEPHPDVVETELPVRIGGRLREEFDHQLNRVELRRMSYLQKMSTILSRRLWDAAGSPEVDTKRLMVSIGLGLGTGQEAIIAYEGFKAKGLRAVSPLAVQMLMPNSAAAAVGLERGAKAGMICPPMADASGAAAIGEAWRHIALGEADVAICGGVDTWIGTVTIAAFYQLGLLSTNNDDPTGACRPFDSERDGTVFGEGGALMLLESREHAEARGATILARVMGVGITSDAYDEIAPDPSGEQAAAAISRALDLAGVTPEEVDLVTAHGSGTKEGDLAEAAAIRLAFGGSKPAVYSPMPALGHTWGAAGALNALVTVYALNEGVVPPTLNFKHLDPAIDLDVVADAPRRGDYRYAVSDCFGFGGHNVALVFGAP